MENQDLAAQLLYNLAKNARIKVQIEEILTIPLKYGGGDGFVLLAEVAHRLQKILYEEF